MPRNDNRCESRRLNPDSLVEIVGKFSFTSQERTRKFFRQVYCDQPQKKSSENRTKASLCSKLRLLISKSIKRAKRISRNNKNSFLNQETSKIFFIIRQTKPTHLVPINLNTIIVPRTANEKELVKIGKSMQLITIGLKNTVKATH